MGFATALSGLKAASNNLSVTGNNIANANTTGFKKSRSEFVDVYTNSISGVNKTQPGAGVRIAEVSQQFSQGSLDLTGNSLDMAINGEGFFTLANNPADLSSVVYSRAGAFQVNDEGIVTNTQGQALLAYKPNSEKVTDGFSVGVLTTVSLNTGAGLPTASTKVDLGVNLDANATAPKVATFDPLNSDSYTKQTSATIYDSLGVSHKLTTYFVAGPATPTTRDWKAYHYITDDPLKPMPLDTGGTNPTATAPGVPGTPATLTFDSSGKLSATAIGATASTITGQLQLAIYPTGTSAADINVKMDYTGSTQLSSAFSVNALKQDGLAAGKLSSISIDDEGVIFARFSNSSSTPLGKVALTRFANSQGLVKLGDTSWGQSAASGEPTPGEPGTGGYGLIQSGALEQSNVDLSEQLVNLIVAQQSYQANSQTISTENSIIQTILNIR
jgi:flagellar hook protein FlgE